MEELRSLMSGPSKSTENKRGNSDINDKHDQKPHMVMPFPSFKRSGNSLSKYNELMRSIRKRSPTRVMRSLDNRFSRIARNSLLNGQNVDNEVKEKLQSKIDLQHRGFEQGDEPSSTVQSNENESPHNSHRNDMLPKQRRTEGDAKMVRMMRAAGGPGDMVRIMRAGSSPGDMVRMMRAEAPSEDMVRMMRAQATSEDMVRMMRAQAPAGDIARMTRAAEGPVKMVIMM